jgi:hypothetical protein
MDGRCEFEEFKIEKDIRSCAWCHMPIILAIWEAEVRQTTDQDQPGQIVQKTPFPK